MVVAGRYSGSAMLLGIATGAASSKRILACVSAFHAAPPQNTLTNIHFPHYPAILNLVPAVDNYPPASLSNHTNILMLCNLVDPGAYVGVASGLHPKRFTLTDCYQVNKAKQVLPNLRVRVPLLYYCHQVTLIL